ncbi:50S ribosomal protein L32 [bacterium]|nr:50S ribosomal protein L32 [bacterium]RKZ33069.1 MAG: 50S ribosomal protein L32 [bacterium]
MAVPKKRQSNTRTRKRRTHYKIQAVNYVECPNCHEPKLPHRVCPHCGYYDGMPIISTKKKEK